MCTFWRNVPREAESCLLTRSRLLREPVLVERNRSAGEKSIATSYRTEESPVAEDVSGSS